MTSVWFKPPASTAVVSLEPQSDNPVSTILPPSTEIIVGLNPSAANVVSLNQTTNNPVSLSATETHVVDLNTAANTVKLDAANNTVSVKPTDSIIVDINTGENVVKLDAANNTVSIKPTDSIIVDINPLENAVGLDPTYVNNVSLNPATNNVVSLANSDNEPITVHEPLAVDNTIVYGKDVNYDSSDIGTFTGPLSNLYTCECDHITDSRVDGGGVNRWFELFYHIPVRTIGLGIIATEGEFPLNFTLEFLSAGGSTLRTYTNTAAVDLYSYTVQVTLPEIVFSGLRISFPASKTATTVSTVFITKITTVDSILYAFNDANTIAPIMASDSSNLRVTDAENGLAIAQGKVVNTTHVSKFGQNNDMVKNIREDIWDLGGTYIWPAAGNADIVRLVSSAADVQPIEVQGLDITGALVVQTVTLTGVVPIALTTSLWRVFRMKNVGSLDIAGNVRATDLAGTTSYAQITGDHNQTLMALYTIPLGKTGYMIGMGASQGGEKEKVSIIIDTHLYNRPYGGVFQLKITNLLLRLLLACLITCVKAGQRASLSH